ncbi:MAG: ABC transporter ATP-binding protein [Lachnospiraceae bacterium]|jgi:teichoic acid transport system ATP-binding protein|nr:ABC transporter ATP-binding protein [Lachnospiraceae bacterium]
MSDVVIKVNGVSKSYKLYEKQTDRIKEAWSLGRKKVYHTDCFALKDIHFEIRKGECVGIIGTNGSGKSTLLKIITGVLKPLCGTVEVKGKISALLELGTGFNMEYTGLKNIYLNGTMMGYSKREMDEKVQDIIDFAEIGEFIYQPVKTYSSGMFARLAFAVAINVDPDILIVDEALSVGDIFFQAKCYKKFNEFQDQGKTILFVSHDLGSVLKYCDKCILINKGQQIQMGDTPDVVNIYRKILVNQYKDEEEKKTQEEPKENLVEFSENRLWKDQLTLNPHVVEYGNGKAEILDFGIFDSAHRATTSVFKGKEFSVEFKVLFKVYLKNPIFAFTIKDLKGTEITGTNTMLEQRNLEEGKEGDIAIVAFCQKMSLQGGQYLLSIACTGYEGDEFVVYHRLYDVCNIHVISDSNTIGFFDMESKVVYR